MLTLWRTGKLMLCCSNQLLQTVQNVDHQNDFKKKKKKKRQRSSELQSHIQLICGLRITFHAHHFKMCHFQFNQRHIDEREKKTVENSINNRRSFHEMDGTKKYT